MISLALPLLLLFPTPAPSVGTSLGSSVGEGWIDDFDKAQAIARETNRDMLVDFTGSDWCTFCKKLKRNVLTTAVFQEKATQDYVLVKVDLPRTAPAIKTVPNIKRNRELAQFYKVRKFPTIMLMTADGQEYVTKGFEETGGLAYWNSLAEARLKMRGPIVEAVDLAKRFETAEPSEREKIAARCVILLPQLPPASSVVPMLIDPVGHYQLLDPDNENGDFGRALRVLLPSGYAKPEHLAAARKLDPRNAQGLRELALLADVYAIRTDQDTRKAVKAIHALDALGPIKDKQAAFILYGNGALWTQRYLRDSEKAKQLARKALPYARGKPLEQQLKRLIGK